MDGDGALEKPVCLKKSDFCPCLIPSSRKDKELPDTSKNELVEPTGAGLVVGAGVKLAGVGLVVGAGVGTGVGIRAGVLEFLGSVRLLEFLGSVQTVCG